MIRLRIFVIAIALVASACSGASKPAPTTEATTTTAPPPPLRELEPGVYEIDWSALGAPPFFGYDTETNPDDPLWLINNQPEVDGFAFSLEMYTTGFGQLWDGATGEFELSCRATGTGICVHFDPDGDGPSPDLNADFEATGKIVIRELDSDGYDLELSEIKFSDGSRIPGPLHLQG